MWPAVDEKLGEEKSPLALMSPNTCNAFVGAVVLIPTLVSLPSFVNVNLPFPSSTSKKVPFPAPALSPSLYV